MPLKSLIAPWPSLIAPWPNAKLTGDCNTPNAHSMHSLSHHVRKPHCPTLILLVLPSLCLKGVFSLSLPLSPVFLSVQGSGDGFPVGERAQSSTRGDNALPRAWFVPGGSLHKGEIHAQRRCAPSTLIIGGGQDLRQRRRSEWRDGAERVARRREARLPRPTTFFFYFLQKFFYTSFSRFFFAFLCKNFITKLF